MIDQKEMVVLNDFPQKIHYKTQDITKPVLLFLHGGPGVSNRHAIILDHQDLLEHFTILTWDQRGTGGSYYHVDVKTLTIDQIVKDAKALVDWACNKFNKDKIFIIGGSWGSALGTLLLHKYPEKIAAFVGFGQVVNGALNETLSYEFAYEQAKLANDSKSLAILDKIGKPVVGCYKGGFEGMMAQRRIMMKYGGYSQNAKKRSYLSATVMPMLTSGEYSFSDVYGLIKGNKLVLSTMWPEVGAIDFPKTCTKFKGRIYIFDGRLDKNTPSDLVQDWFDSIEAVDKELIWFENSGHNPMSDEPKKFKTLLVKKLMEVKEKEKVNI